MNIKKINTEKFSPIIHTGKVSKVLIVVCVFVSLIYLAWWFDFSHVGNKYLYVLLF